MNHKKTANSIPMIIIMAAGILLRLFYVLFSTIYERQYDIGMIDLSVDHTVSGGHLAYIQYLYQNGHLADIDPTAVYQFHHPPFHYFVCSLWLKFASHFITDVRELEESIQVVPFVCSVVILVVLAKILDVVLDGNTGENTGDGSLYFPLKSTFLGPSNSQNTENRPLYSKAMVMAVFAFHPSLIMLAGSVNNDCMGLMFTLVCVYETILWYLSVDVLNTGYGFRDINTGENTGKNTGDGSLYFQDEKSGKALNLKDNTENRPLYFRGSSRRHMILLALYLGLGIMTKQNVAEMAFPIGFVFAVVFIRELLRKPEEGRRTGMLLRQYVVFLLISVPLALWFYVRNLVKYGTPLVWVYELGKDSWQYVGNVPWQYHFLLPRISDMLDNLRHFQIGCGYNVWMQIFRTSVLGEWDMAGVGKGVKILAVLLMLLGALLAAAAFIGMIAASFRIFVKTIEDKRGERYWDKSYAQHGILWLFLLLTYVVNMIFYLKFVYDYPQECSMNFRYIVITLVTPMIGLGYAMSGAKHGRRAIAVLVVLFCLASAAMTAAWCI